MLSPVPIQTSIINKTLAAERGRQAYTIVERLTDAGFDTWWVGGPVRDMLRGNLPHDIDIATAAEPDEVSKLFKRSIDAASKLGSVRVVLGNTEFEITTFRRDDEASDGRHPESVVFGDREQDASRRDFTVNAIYWNPISRELYDPFDGEADLKEKLVRFIGEPAVRIRHDALRLLRGVRLRATLDGQYHPETYRAIQELASLVETLSGTRQFEEMEKMLLCPHPDRAFEDLWELGILKYFLRELHDCKGVAQPADYHKEGDVWEHTLQCLRSFREEDGIDVRLAALFHDAGKVETFSLEERIRFDHHASVSADIVEAVLGRLQCPKKRRDKISWLVKHHMMMGAFFEMDDTRKSHWYFHPWFPELLQLFWLDVAGTTPSEFDLYDRIMKDYDTFLDAHPRPPKALLSGEDIMEMLHLKPGEEVGRILKSLHQAQIEKHVTTKAEAIEFVKRLAQ